MNNSPFAVDADTATANGTWFNTRVYSGVIYGPVSGDAITKMIAFDAAINAIHEAGRRPYVHTGFECGAL